MAPGHPVVTLGSFVTSGFPPELVSTPFSGQASRAGINTYLWRGRTVLPVLKNSKPFETKVAMLPTFFRSRAVFPADSGRMIRARGGVLGC